jgi:hypothetical protein
MSGPRPLCASTSTRITSHARTRDAKNAGHFLGESGRWYSDGSGSLVPYCKTCAEVEFPVL